MISRVNILDRKGNIAIVEVPIFVTEVLKELELGELAIFDTVMEFAHVYSLKVIEFNGKLVSGKYTTCINVNESIILLDGEESLLHIDIDDTIVTLEDTKTCVFKKFNKFISKYLSN